MDFDQPPHRVPPPQQPGAHPPAGQPQYPPQQYPAQQYPGPQQYPDPQQYPAAPQHAPNYPQQYPQHQGPPAGRTSFGRCMLGALVWVGVLVLAIAVTVGLPSSGHAAGTVLGRMLVPWLLASFVTWLVLRRRARAFWVVTLVALPGFLFFVVLTAGALVGRT